MAWTIGNFVLSQSQMDANAVEVYKYFSAKGWTLNAIAGICGNMQSESWLNPGVWQSLKEGNYSGGFGLVQWTPATNYTNWSNANGYGITDPNGHLSWSAFKKSSQTPEWLASAFLKNFERAGVEVEATRRSQARYYYNLLSKYDTNSKAVESAVRWAINIANDDSHGYDQTHRDGPNYDCSSLVCWAYYQAGLNTRPGYTPATGTMYNVFLAAGFEDVTSSVNLTTGEGIQRGDVLLNTVHHTAMSIGNGQVVNASQNEHGGATGGATGDQTGKEIYVRNYYNYPWNYVLRLPGGGGAVEPEGVYIVRWIPG